MNRKGQALIEFVLILPVFLMILFLVIDFGTIYVAKMKLESTSTEIIDSYYDNHDLSTIKDKYKTYVINDSKEEDIIKIIDEWQERTGFVLKLEKVIIKVK